MNRVYIVSYSNVKARSTLISQEGYSRFEDAVKFIEERGGVRDGVNWKWIDDKKCVFKINEIIIK